MPSPKRPPPNPESHIPALPTDKLSALLLALARNDLEAAKKAGGGMTRAQILELQPDGDMGAFLDGLEQRAAFLLRRETRLTLWAALPVAIEALRGLVQAPKTLREAIGAMKPGDTPELAPGTPIEEQARAIRAGAFDRLPQPKIMEQQRHAIGMLFSLANYLKLYDMAEGFREGDKEASEEEELKRMAEAQGLDYIPPLRMIEDAKNRVQ